MCSCLDGGSAPNHSMHQLPSLHPYHSCVHAAEAGDEDIDGELEAQASVWAAAPPPSPAPFKAQLVLHNVRDLASLGSNSTTPTTLGWLWSQATAAAVAGVRLTSVAGAPSATEEAGCQGLNSPIPPPHTAMQPTSAMHLPAMLVSS